MSSWIQVAKIGELGHGGVKEVTALGHKVLLARVGDKYYATDNCCPHMGQNLSGGKLEGTILTCAKHSAQFDLTDGHVVRWSKRPGFLSRIRKASKSPKPLTKYNVKVEDSKILVEI